TLPSRERRNARRRILPVRAEIFNSRSRAGRRKHWPALLCHHGGRTSGSTIPHSGQIRIGGTSEYSIFGSLREAPKKFGLNCQCARLEEWCPPARLPQTEVSPSPPASNGPASSPSLRSFREVGRP